MKRTHIGGRSLAERWNRLWFTDVPPHAFALLRIAFGSLGLVSLFALVPLDMFWALDGLSPLSSDNAGPRALVAAWGLGDVVGYGLFAFLAVSLSAMTLGYRSDAAVLGSFIGLVLQNNWNPLPLSSAQQVLEAVIFCLVWARTGQVWSVDARLAGPNRNVDSLRAPIWPLQLIRFQIALVYVSSGVWKLYYPVWRDGSAVQLALDLNVFHRFPWPVPPSADPWLLLVTWGTLLFELLFPVLVWFRATRRVTLAMGIVLHLGLWVTLELGPFSWVMMASYLAFVSPDTMASFGRRGPAPAPVLSA